MYYFIIYRFFPCLSVLQIVKFQSSPAKVRMMVDSHHSTPREMTFESARVRRDTDVLYLLESAVSLIVTHCRFF